MRGRGPRPCRLTIFRTGLARGRPPGRKETFDTRLASLKEPCDLSVFPRSAVQTRGALAADLRY